MNASILGDGYNTYKIPNTDFSMEKIPEIFQRRTFFIEQKK
jgi:hypothetical protein